MAPASTAVSIRKPCLEATDERPDAAAEMRQRRQHSEPFRGGCQNTPAATVAPGKRYAASTTRSNTRRNMSLSRNRSYRARQNAEW